MKSRNKKKILFALLCFCLYFFSLKAAAKGIFEGGRDFAGYVLDVKYEGGNFSILEHDSSGERLEVRLIGDIDDIRANEIIEEKIILFKSIFTLKRTGYPGQHTMYIDAPEKFKPEYIEKETKKGPFRYFTCYANGNYTPGASSKDLAKYRMLYGFLYNIERETLIEVKYFVSIELSPDRIERFVEIVYSD